MVETLARILSKTKLAPRPLTTIEARLELCLELHQKPIDNADDVIHGSWLRLVSIKKQRVCSLSQPSIFSGLLFQSKLFAAILQPLK